MDHFGAGIVLILIGSLVGVITYKRYKLFWEFVNTRLLRKWFGDYFTTVLLYIVSTVLIIVGILLSVGVVR